jgi:hypothetical protein
MSDTSDLVIALVAVCASVLTAVALWRPAGPAAAIGLGAVIAVPGVGAGDPVLPVAVAVVAVLGRRWYLRGEVPRSAFRGLLPQVGLICAGYVAYTIARLASRAGASEAIANSHDIVRFERGLGLFVEPHVQAAFSQGLLAGGFNHIYLSLYYPLPVAALLVLYLRDRHAYRIFRDSLAISAALAAVAIALFPVAPPRLVPGLGIVDTIDPVSQARALANQFAAVPSLHVGWPALVGLMMAARGNRWLRLLSPLPGGVMLITVMTTGNHYWFDAAAGIAFSIGPALYMLAAPRPAEAPEAAPQAAGDSAA